MRAPAGIPDAYAAAFNELAKRRLLEDVALGFNKLFGNHPASMRAEVTEGGLRLSYHPDHAAMFAPAPILDFDKNVIGYGYAVKGRVLPKYITSGRTTEESNFMRTAVEVAPLDILLRMREGEGRPKVVSLAHELARAQDAEHDVSRVIDAFKTSRDEFLDTIGKGVEARQRRLDTAKEEKAAAAAVRAAAAPPPQPPPQPKASFWSNAFVTNAKQRNDWATRSLRTPNAPPFESGEISKKLLSDDHES